MSNVWTNMTLTALLLGLPMPADAQSDANAIRDVRQKSNEAIARHDIDAFLSFLDDEYQITTSLGQMSRGKDQERKTLVTLFQNRPDALYVRTPDTIEISRKYPLAAESGNWVGTWTSAQGPVRTGGTYLAMWRNTNGGWKIRSELFVALYCDGAGCP